MKMATFWQNGEKRVGTGGHESDGYPCVGGSSAIGGTSSSYDVDII